jgi:hypothetical protein
MFQGPLKPYHFKDFQCDRCQKEKHYKLSQNQLKKPKTKELQGRTRQLNLKVKAQTYQKLKEFSLKEKCLMTEILEKALECYEKHSK